jgi:uncharacterized protein YigE (DUF2233 family)
MGGTRMGIPSIREARRFFLFVLCGLTAIAGSGCRPKLARVPSSPVIREVVGESNRYAVAEFSLEESRLRLFWKTPDGARIGTFEKLNALVSASGNRLVFATNAGIFDSTFTPCGLYVENAVELVPLNLKSGSGNFYLKPNGIFLIDDRGATIIESSQYPSRTGRTILATQSGPLLLINRKVNPQFAADSSNRRIRSGVGVISSDQVAFVLSHDPVTFYEFALFFQTTLGCTAALYPDGEISSFYPNPNNAPNTQSEFAGIFAITHPD